MSLAEKLSQGAITTVVGMLIVFSVLFILFLLLNLLKVIFYRKNTNEKVEVVTQKPKQNDEELVAVISAAVYQMLGEGSMPKYKIRSFKRANKRKF